MLVRPRALLVVVAVGLVGAAGAAGVAAAAPETVASSGGLSLVRVHDGLAMARPFSAPAPLRDIEDDFSFGGSAAPGVGYVSLGSSGLVVGVQSHPDRYEGWFAVTNWAFPASGVYHVRMSKPAGDVSGPNEQGEAVFAVQTGTTKRTGLINYVVVATDSAGGLTSWMVGYSHGKLRNAVLDTYAQSLASTATPDTEDVTLATDGRHSLRVWFGSRLVFGSDQLSMQIDPPYQPYLEVQARRIAYSATFSDFWVTESSSLEVSGLPAGQPARLVSTTGDTLAQAVATSSGTTFSLPPPAARGRAYLVFERGGHPVRLGPFDYSGGDSYRLG